MPQVLRLDDGDARIQYASSEAWETVVNSGQEWNRDGTYHRAKAAGAQLFFLFRGTGVSLYGLSGTGGGLAQLQLDGRNIEVPINQGNSSGVAARLLNFQGLAEGDHQLFVFLWMLDGQKTVNITVDYFEIENDGDKGFDLLWAGPNATNIPKEAVLVESSSQDVQLSSPSQWTNTNDSRVYGRNTWYTASHGATLKYTFEGVAIWYYGSVDIPNAFYNVSLDSSDPERLSATNPTGLLTQQMLWSKVGLTPGRYTFTLTQDDDNGKYVNLNYFRVLLNEDASALPSSAFPTAGSSTIFSVNPPTSTAPTSAPSSSPSNSSTIFLAVGLSIGLLCVVVIILVTFLYIRRSRRKERSLEVDAQLTTPHFVVPSRTGPITRKQPLSIQHRRSEPETSEIYSSGLDTPNSSELMSTGLPPSYESHFRHGRVVLPQ